MNHYQTNTLTHHGVKGMKWGVRKKNDFRPTSIRGYLAKRANRKVDKNFDDWNKNAELKKDAIAKGKLANKKLAEVINDPKNKALKKEHKQLQSAYKKALKKNTHYRQGYIRNEVGADESRKYLSAAKKIKKSIDSGQASKNDVKKYNSLMNKHAIAREKARRAPEVGLKRSQRIANMKRGMTMTVKSTAILATVTVGTKLVSKYLREHNVTLDGRPLGNMKVEDVMKTTEYIKTAKDILGYFY